MLKADVKNYLNPTEFAEKSNYFFTHPTFDSKDSLRAIVKFRKTTGMSTSEIYYGFIEQVERTREWTLDALKALQLYGQDLDEETWTNRMRLLRIAVCGGRSGPSMAETMMVLGKERVVRRLRDTDRAFVEFKGELEAEEQRYLKSHDKMLKQFQEQQRRERLESQGIKQTARGKLDSRSEAKLRGVIGPSPMEKKGFKYMSPEMRARVQKDWEKERREEEIRMFPGRGREKNWVKPGEEVRIGGEGQGKWKGREEPAEAKKGPREKLVKFEGLQKKWGGGGGGGGGGKRGNGGGGGGDGDWRGRK